MADSCAVAARQQWGSQGIFLPETLGFDGLAELPDDIAAEMRDLYLVRKPMAEASPEFLEFSSMRQPHSSRWNWWESGAWSTASGARAAARSAVRRRHAHLLPRRQDRLHVLAALRVHPRRGLASRSGVPHPPRRRRVLSQLPQHGERGPTANTTFTTSTATSRSATPATPTRKSPRCAASSRRLSARRRFSASTPKCGRCGRSFSTTSRPLPRSDNPEVVALRQRGGGRGGRGGGGGRRGGGAPDDGRPYWVRALPPIRSGGPGRPDGNTMPMWFFDLARSKTRTLKQWPWPTPRSTATAAAAAACSRRFPSSKR